MQRTNLTIPILALLFFLGLFVSTASADVGRLLEVVDGDTFKAEISGKHGPETIEVNLRCSDAPALGSLFGPDARQYLQQLLSEQDSFSYKTLAYCGSQSCVEALIYFPPAEGESLVYLNAQMIEAGMARNSACRGVFEKAEELAKQQKRGIWSTDRKIAYTEQVKPATQPAPATQQQVAAPKPASEPEPSAVLQYDRAERTVTMQSRQLSLIKAVELIDKVSSTPVKLYLEKDQYISVNLVRRPWYEALGYLIEQAGLKKVVMNNQIDLYTPIFYYKNVAPYLKVSGSLGGASIVGSGDKTPEKDDGTTRYVFVNDYENQAAATQKVTADKAAAAPTPTQQEDEPAPVAPAKEVSDKTEPAPVAKPAVVEESVEKPSVEEKPVTAAKPEPAAAADEKPMATKPAAPAPTQQPADEKSTSPEQEGVKEPAKPSEKPAEQKPAVQKSDAAPAPAEEVGFNPLYAAIVVAILLLVVGICFLLTRCRKEEEPGETTV